MEKIWVDIVILVGAALKKEGAARDAQASRADDPERSSVPQL